MKRGRLIRDILQDMLLDAVKAVEAGKKIVVFCQSLKKLSLARSVYDAILEKNHPTDPSWTEKSTICHAQLEDATKTS